MKLRITHYGQAAPGDLKPHPLNARIHSPAQQSALTALLESVGWVKHLVVNTRTGYLLNGHLRLAAALEAGLESVPVAYVDLSDEEERLLLGLFDAVGSLALTDVERLEVLLTEAQAQAEPLQALLDRMAFEAGIGLDFPASEDDETPAASEVAVKIGELRLLIDPDVFLRWQDQLFRTVGFDEASIIAEIRRRLAL